MRDLKKRVSRLDKKLQALDAPFDVGAPFKMRRYVPKKRSFFQRDLLIPKLSIPRLPKISMPSFEIPKIPAIPKLRLVHLVIFAFLMIGLSGFFIEPQFIGLVFFEETHTININQSYNQTTIELLTFKDMPTSVMINGSVMGNDTIVRLKTANKSLILMQANQPGNFSEACIETCDISSLEGEIVLEIETTDSIIEIDTLTYTTSYENLEPVWISLKNSFRLRPDVPLTLNLSNFIIDPEQENMTFLVTSEQPIDALVSGSMLTMVTRSELVKSYPVTIIAADPHQLVRINISIEVFPGAQALENAPSFIDKKVIDHLSLIPEADLLIKFSDEYIGSLTQTNDTDRNQTEEIKQYVSAKQRLFKEQFGTLVDEEKNFSFFAGIAAHLTLEEVTQISQSSLVKEIYLDEAWNITRSDSLPQINAPSAHTITVGSTPIRGKGQSICIIDTGIDQTHAEFDSRIADQYCYCSITDNGNGGCCASATSEDNNADDDNSHGTHVAGIAAGENGVAPQAEIVAVKACDSTGACGISDVILALEYCMTNKDVLDISVITASIGDQASHDNNTCPTFLDTTLQAADSLGLSTFFASGNNGYQDGINYPACSPSVISVGAVDKSDNIAPYSNMGVLLDLLAPGSSISSTIPPNTSGQKSGTSMATPHASGAALLLYQQASLKGYNYTSSQIREILKRTGKDIQGFPRIDIESAVSMGIEGFVIDDHEKTVDTSFGRIKFHPQTDMARISTCATIRQHSISINTELCPEYNQSATLTFKDIAYTPPYLIVMDNQTCPEDVCSNLTFQGNNISVNVSHFTEFTLLGTGSGFFLTSALGNLSCTVRNDTTCLGGETKMFAMSNFTNAHAELANESNYNFSVCCSDLNVANTISSTSGFDFIALSDSTDAHVELRNQPHYYLDVFIDANNDDVACQYPDSFGQCGGVFSCLATLSTNQTQNASNLMVASCDNEPFQTSVCCGFVDFANFSDVQCSPDPVNVTESSVCNITITPAAAIVNVSGNVTLINDTEFNYSVTNDSSRYSFTFTDSTLVGRHEVFWAVLDTTDLLSEFRHNLTVMDPIPPNITPIGCSPFEGPQFGTVLCNASVFDNFKLGEVRVNVTLPNFTIREFILENQSENFFLNFSETDLFGQYDMVWWANDTGNLTNYTPDLFHITFVCSDLNSSFTLTNNLSSTGSCVNMTDVKDIDFDCNGHTMSGSKTESAFNILNGSNVTIRNCIINDYFDGIRLNGTEDSWFINNTINGSNNTGIMLWASSYNTFNNNTILGALIGVNMTNGTLKRQFIPLQGFSQNNTFLHNNFTGPSELFAYTDQQGNNLSTGQNRDSGFVHVGNSYEGITGFDLRDFNIDSFAERGTDYPINSTNSGNITGALEDFGPIISPNSTHDNSRIFNSTKINSSLIDSYIFNSTDDASLVINSSETLTFMNNSAALSSNLTFISIENSTSKNSSLTNSSFVNSSLINSSALNSSVLKSIIINSSDDGSNISIAFMIDVISRGSILINATVNASELINITMVGNSTVTSSVNASLLLESVLIDSQIVNSTINTSTIIGSVLEFSAQAINTTIRDSLIRSSRVTLDETINSSIMNSTIFDSLVVNTSVMDSTFNISQVFSSVSGFLTDVFNSTTRNSNLTNATIKDSDLTNTTIKNASTYNTQMINTTITSSTTNNTNIFTSTIQFFTDLFNATTRDSKFTNVTIRGNLTINTTADNSTLYNSLTNDSLINSSMVNMSHITDSTLLYDTKTINATVNNSLLSNSTQIHNESINTSVENSTLISSRSINSSFRISTVRTSSIISSVIKFFSQLVNATLDRVDSLNSTIISSQMTNSSMLNSTSFDSETTNSTINISGINGSVLFSTKVTQSDIFDASVNQSVIINSTILLNQTINSTLSNTALVDASVVNSSISDSFVNKSIYFTVNSSGSVPFNTTVNNSIFINSSQTLNRSINSSIINSTMMNSFIFNASMDKNSTIIDAVILTSDHNGSYIFNSTSMNVTAVNFTSINSTSINSTMVDSIATYSRMTDMIAIRSNLTYSSPSNTTVIGSTLINLSNISRTILIDTNQTFNITHNSTIENTTLLRSFIINSSVKQSDITNSSLFESIVRFFFSTNTTLFNVSLTNSTVTNTTIFNSSIGDSLIFDSLVINSSVNPTNLTGAVINHSIINDSVVNFSIIINSTLINTTVVNSTVVNSIKIDSFILDSNISHSNNTFSRLLNATEFLCATDNITLSNSTCFNSTMIDNNHFPFLGTPLPKFVMKEGDILRDELNLSRFFSDIDGNNFTYSVLSDPFGLLEINKEFLTIIAPIDRIGTFNSFILAVDDIGQEVKSNAIVIEIQEVPGLKRMIGGGVSAQPPPPPTPPTIAKTSSPGASAIGLSRAAVQDTGISCGFITRKTSVDDVISHPSILSPDVVLPKGKQTAITPFKMSCDGDDLDLTLSLPDNYEDIEVLRCKGGDCSKINGFEVDLETLRCGNLNVSEIRKRQLDAAKKLEFVPPEILAQQGKLLSESDSTIDMGKYLITTRLQREESMWMRMSTVDFTLPEPKNPSFQIVGVPVTIQINRTIGGKIEANLTLPYANLSGFDNRSLRIYAFINNTWKSLGGIENASKSTVTYQFDDLRRYMEDDKAILGILGITCPNCVRSEFKKIYDPGSRDAVILVHGLLSSPITWQLLIDDFSLNKQPWQMWTFGYRSDRSIKQIAEDLKIQLELNSGKFDNIYILGHSLGGLVAEEALASAHDQKSRGIKDYSFIDKVSKVISVGSPHEGSPAAKVYDNFYNQLSSQEDVSVAGGASKELLAQLEKGHIAKRVPGIKYYAIAGTKGYDFNLGLFTISTQDILNLTQTNDGIVTVPSVQNIGGEYVNNKCDDYFEVNLTHTDLIDNPVPRRVMSRIITQDIAKKDHEKALIGYNQYVRVQIARCDPDEVYAVIGKKIDPLAAKAPLGCGCGNGVCGIGESIDTCPQDCAKELMVSPYEKWIYYGSRLILFLISLGMLFFIRWLIHKKQGPRRTKKIFKRLRLPRHHWHLPQSRLDRAKSLINDTDELIKSLDRINEREHNRNPGKNPFLSLFTDKKKGRTGSHFWAQPKKIPKRKEQKQDSIQKKRPDDRKEKKPLFRLPTLPWFSSNVKNKGQKVKDKTIKKIKILKRPKQVPVKPARSLFQKRPALNKMRLRSRHSKSFLSKLKMPKFRLPHKKADFGLSRTEDDGWSTEKSLEQLRANLSSIDKRLKKVKRRYR